MSFYEILFRASMLIAIGTILAFGGIAHMRIMAEIKDIKRELMQKDADIRRIERRLY